MALAFEMRNISKKFPGVLANQNVSISAEKGSVLCVIGENGAGKSTLMNILYGMIQPDEGEIVVEGKQVHFSSSSDAMKARIGMVFQHFMLIKELSCLENIIIGMEPMKGLMIDPQKARKLIKELMKQYNMEIPLDSPAGDLWVGLQQKLEILKTLYRGAEIIILDEPTAVLTPQETEELFINIRSLVASGKTIILITHKLDEVMRVADDIVVMRAGAVVARVKPEETDINQLSRLMVGKEIPPMRERVRMDNKECLKLTNVTAYDRRGLAALKEINLTLHKGEILGIAGISGNGQEELAQVATGLMVPQSGSIKLNGTDITTHRRHEKIRDGISYIPADRTSVGTCLDWSIENNSFAGYEWLFTNKFGVIDRKKTKQHIAGLIEKYQIKAPNGDVPMRSLSGGNMQKVVVGREAAFAPQIIVASEPTRGVDIGAISIIHDNMISLRNSGCAILLISSSLDEIFALSDRIHVLFEGEIVAELNPKMTSREEIGLYMSGTKRQEGESGRS